MQPELIRFGNFENLMEAEVLLSILVCSTIVLQRLDRETSGSEKIGKNLRSYPIQIGVPEKTFARLRVSRSTRGVLRLTILEHGTQHLETCCALPVSDLRHASGPLQRTSVLYYYHHTGCRSG